jgi:hypothetical protein
MSTLQEMRLFDLQLEAVGHTETTVNIYKWTQRYIP